MRMVDKAATICQRPSHAESYPFFTQFYMLQYMIFIGRIIAELDLELALTLLLYSMGFNYIWILLCFIYILFLALHSWHSLQIHDIHRERKSFCRGILAHFLIALQFVSCRVITYTRDYRIQSYAILLIPSHAWSQFPLNFLFPMIPNGFGIQRNKLWGPSSKANDWGELPWKTRRRLCTHLKPILTKTNMFDPLTG